MPNSDKTQLPATRTTANSSTELRAYEDFFYFSQGVYHHVTGKQVAGHAVSIAGWNDLSREWAATRGR